MALRDMFGIRKPSLFIVLVLLFAVVHSEFPELMHLRDDVSNDFTVSACGSQPVLPSAMCDPGVPITGSVPACAIPARALHVFQYPTAAIPLHLTGQDLLLLGSIHRT
jgi:hypothetical protein